MVGLTSRFRAFRQPIMICGRERSCAIERGFDHCAPHVGVACLGHRRVGLTQFVEDREGIVAMIGPANINLAPGRCVRPVGIDAQFARGKDTGEAFDQRAVGERHGLSPCAVNIRPRKGFIRAYEQRMDTLVTHPLFGYRVSYRRVLEIQARLVARVVTGELERYPGFETR